MRRFKKKQVPFSHFSDFIVVHLNDTHPSIGIPELMRLLMDEEKMGWDEAWDICVRTFAYTNHTILPEALETWPVELLSRVLPRHMEIIFEINRRFLEEVERRHPGDVEMQARMSLIQEGAEKRVRMDLLAIVGSHKVNGVAELHTQILKNSIFKEFDAFFPDRIINITNGVTPRRWLLQANPNLSRLISSMLGKGWIRDLRQLKKLVPLSKDSAFREAWQEVKKVNKNHLAKYILRRTGMKIDPASMYDVQAKRIHEYKRQLLNVLHVITLYNRIKANTAGSMVSRTVIFAGKAAPGYARAKLIIKLINSVADVVNNDPEISGLKVVFLPNYCVSQAEKLVPSADLSQQISMAGMEASGTGNMKFALNDALTIGTLDGANIEIMEAVGRDNLFIFGLNAKEVVDLKASGYRPRQIYESDPELKQAIDQMYSGHFSPDNSRLFDPICDELLGRDKYMVMADYRPYLEAQAKVDQLYDNPHEWTRRSILNSANMGWFSSDRAVLEYASKVWNVQPLNDDFKK
jgi:starch phosphorylase